MNNSTVRCDTTLFRNGSKIFWQFNCKRIWLTFQNAKGNNKVINDVPVELFGYTYRLGYSLIKEYNNILLFRSGCSANGPCTYHLINKETGESIKDFPQLICIDNDVTSDSSYQFEFVVYLSGSKSEIMVYFIDSNKSVSFPFVEKLSGAIPEYQFEMMKLEGGKLTLFYNLNDEEQKSITINLADKK